MDPIPRSKKLLGKIYSISGLKIIENIFVYKTNKYILAVNYHDVTEVTEGNFTSQLKYFSDRYKAVDRSTLDSFLRGDWPYDKPGIMFHFDDGLSSHYNIVAPALDKFRFTGWFHVVTDHLDNENIQFAELNGKDSMTWSQAEDLAIRGHEICSHTCSHKRMGKNLTDKEIKHEVYHSFMRIKEELHVEPPGFCWPGGEIDAYDPRAMKMIMSMYKYAFPSYTKRIIFGTSPYALNRCNIEATWSMSSVLLSTSIIWELKHKKRAELYSFLILS